MISDRHSTRVDSTQFPLFRLTVTQPVRPVPCASPPISLASRGVHLRSRRVKRSTSRRGRPRLKRVRRRSWRGCLLPLLSLALIVCLGPLLVYGLFLAQPPVNVLILGIDRRPDEGNATRTDTIILLHADAGAGRLVLLSIPRDLWVTIPGWREERINAAHLYGELEAPGNGPARTAETVSYNFGVPVHHTMRLDFEAFREVIDAAGGIDVDVPAPIIDDAYPTPNYGTMRVEIPAGLQHMDGETALRYARSRHGSSDFDRAARQQQILIALAKKVISPSGLFSASRARRAFQEAVETDLSTRDLIRLALAWQRAGESGLEQIIIDHTLTTPFRTAQGAAVLLPQWELIHPLVERQFRP